MSSFDIEPQEKISQAQVQFWKKLAIGTFLTNLFFLGLLFYVKYNAKEQANEFVRETQLKSEFIVKESNKIHQYNNILWELAVQIGQGPKDKKSVMLLCREWQKKYKDQIELKISDTSRFARAFKIGWPRYDLYLEFDENDQLKKINVDDLMERLAPLPSSTQSQSNPSTP